jgi:4-phospho-D-threonate 3-dehydrogenase / 4-phospho-D-erythronate 3-dehydrogenase
MTLPIIAITIGDPSGIGPEIALKSAADARVRKVCRPLLVGDFAIVEFYRDRFALPVALNPVTGVEAAGFKADALDVLDVASLPLDGFEPGVATPGCGRAILDYASRAVDLALDGAVAAIVAGPQTQKAIRAAGIDFDGYPRYIASRTGADPDDVFLMLYSDDFRIVHVTLHAGLRAALDLIDRDRVLKTLLAADRAVRDLGVDWPRIAVSGVNPHAGEGGLFGREEIEHITPAIAAAQAEGIDAHGPFGADTMYLDRSYDAYVVMTHDQGHIPAKLLGFDSTAAFTIGTPVFFATVAHGSAADIAGKGVADPGAMTETLIRMANVGRIRRPASSRES